MPDSRTRDGDTGAPDVEAMSKPSAGDVRAQLDRILASRCFQQAGRASDFLRFVVEQTLAGAGQRLKGYTIGVEVFGRPADFDAQSDALVRVEAGRLRRRLVEYYAGEGSADAVKIELPRGTYAVECRFVAAHEQEAVPAHALRPPPAVVQTPSRWRRVALGLGALLVAAVAVIAWQRTQLREASRSLVQIDAPQRTEWPRIVVVPFENLSANPALDVLAASMTEEIMLRLDDLDLFVVASQASWYGPSEETSFDAEASGGYVLTGSVRGKDQQARITARLIEAETGRQLWTTAYDEPLSGDRAALLERVARDIAVTAAPYGPIFEAELARARRSARAPMLRDCFAQYHEYRRRVTPEGYDETLECLKSVSARQPDVASVWSGLAMLYVDEYASSFGRTGDTALESARRATAKALAIDRDDFLANLALTRVQFFADDPAFRQGIERTIALRPTSAQAYSQGGFLLVITGDSEQGLELAEKGRELAKVPLGFYHLTYAASYLQEGRFAEALASAQSVDGQNWVFAQAVLAAAAAHAGRLDLAQNAAARIRELYPQFEDDALANFERWHFDAQFQEALVSGLRAAGLDLGKGKSAPSGA